MCDRHLRRGSIRSRISHSTPETTAKDIHRSDILYSSSSSPVWNVPVIQGFLAKHTSPRIHRQRSTRDCTFEAPEPALAAAVERLIEDDEGLTPIALALLYGNDSPDEWATISRTLEYVPAWDSGYVADAGKGDEADTAIRLLGAFVTPSATQLLPTSCFSFTPSRFLPLAPSMSSMSTSTGRDSPGVGRSGEVTLARSKR